MLRHLFRLIVAAGVLGGGGYWGWRALQTVPPMARVEKALAANDLFGAQVILRGMIKADPRDARAHLLLAQTQLASSDWVSAEKELKVLRALGQDRAVVSPMLVQAYAMQRRYPDILADIPAVASKPEEQAMNLALRSVAYLGMNELSQAQGMIDAAAKLAPDEFLVHLQWARLALVRKDAAMATREAEAAVRLRPDSTQALQAMSEALLLRWDSAGAIEALDRAVAVAPMSQDLRLARAWLLMTLGMDRQAQADVVFVFNITSSNALAQYYNAILMFRAQQYADANVEFDKLGGLMDQFPRSHFFKAQIALQMGNKQSALESLDRLLRLLPGDSEGIRLAAEVELTLGHAARALALLGPITGMSSRDSAAIDLQGRAHFMLGRTGDAVGSFRRATEIAPENKVYGAHLAAAQTRFGVAPAPGEDDPPP